MSSNPFRLIALAANVLILLAAPGIADAGQNKTATRPHSAPQRVSPKPGLDPAAAIEGLMETAESALQAEEVQIAESRYRDALLHGWMLVAALDVAQGRLTDARDALRRAVSSAVDAASAQRYLAMLLLQTGEQPEALRILTRLASSSSRDATLRRLLAQALVANGQPEQAVQELEEARGIMPDNLELAFALASGYLRLKKVAAAESLLDNIARARPQAQTYILIGRTYRDFGEYARAKDMLRRALAIDPRARRAHYYAGTIAIMEEGYVRADEAISEFRAELALAPDDPVTQLRLGIVLEGTKRHAEALPLLERSAASPVAGRDAFEYLGKCQLALGRTTEGAQNLQRALDARTASGSDDRSVGALHYQLGQALRTLGREQAAATHFAEAQRLSERRVEEDRARLGRYLADIPHSDETTSNTAAVLLESGPIAQMPLPQREALRRRTTDAIARAYLNLGIVQARANRFARAAEFFEGAAAANPAFPELQYSLGVAYFNAGQFEKATDPLSRVGTDDTHHVNANRMLALTFLNLQAYEKAAALLQDDPLRTTDPSLQYAYGLALVRSNRSSEAAPIFDQLLAAHGDSPELNVLMGVAHAQQGDFDSAVTSLQRALALKADVREANATLGTIYLKQGKLDEAAEVLRSELARYPDETTARQTLAAVLELQGQPEEAVSQLRTVLRQRPQFADARYLIGKLLLAQGKAAEAVDHLELAARLAPDDANIHFQLAQAYQKTGRADLAEREFERYRQLKDKKREGSR